MRLMTRAELHERRAIRERRKKKGKKVRHKSTRAKRSKDGVRATIVSSVSLPPELKIRAARDLGGGSFSKGVVYALRKALRELDDKE